MFGYEVKDAPDGTNQTPEPEVVENVLKEIKALGDNAAGLKKQYEELRKAHEGFVSLIDERGNKIDAETKQQITKFTEDITTRQNELDKKMTDGIDAFNKRMDNLEVATQRLGGETESDEEIAVLRKQARDFQIASMAVRDKGGKGATFARIKDMEVDVESYKSYREASETFYRLPLDSHFLTPEMSKSLSVGVDPDGGYTVTPVISDRVVTRLFESDPMRQLCSVETISTGAMEMLVDWGQAGYGWEGETESGAETETPTFKKKRIPVHVMYAKPRATQTLLEDSAINIENWLADHVAKRFMRAEGAAFVAGDGVAQPTGFLNYPNGTNFGQIQRTNMGAAAALTYNGLVNVKFSLIEEYLTRGTWLMNRLTVADVLQIKDGDGNSIWKPGLSEKEPSMILGLPVRMSTTMPVVAANALSVAIADWAEAYTIVDRLGITIQRDPFTQKPFVEFYTRKRVGGDVVDFMAIKLGCVAV